MERDFSLLRRVDAMCAVKTVLVTAESLQLTFKPEPSVEERGLTRSENNVELESFAGYVQDTFS